MCIRDRYKIESVTDTMEYWTFVGVQNYQKLFTTAIFKTAMFNIFKIWAIGGAIVLAVSLLFAVILTSGIRGKKIFRAIIYLPNIVDVYKRQHHSTVKEACQLAEELGVPNLLLYHTEETHLKERKELYTAEGREYYHGNLYVPDDMEEFIICT